MSPAVDSRFGQPRTLVFGIGAQKSGTSWLDRYLREHPEVSLPVRKEPHYWDTLRLAADPARRARAAAKLESLRRMGWLRRVARRPKRRRGDRAWALADAMLRTPSPTHSAYADLLFQTYAGQPVAGEITPSYALLGADAFAEMAALAPDVRFVFILRDPVTRLLSGTRQSAIKRRDREGLAGEDMPKRLSDALRGGDDPDFLRSRYDLTIRRLESAVPRDRICYLFFETLFRQSEVDRLTDFLGIARRPAKFARKVNASDPSGDRIGAETVAAARAALAPVFEFARARFGAQAIEAWPHALADEATAVPARTAGSGRM